VIRHGVEVFVALDLDLRWGFHRLAGVVTERLGWEARSGALFVFFGKRRDAIEVPFFDGSGICLFYKRLDAGTFRVPAASRVGDAVLQIEERALDDLLDGIDLTSAPPVRRRDALTSRLSPRGHDGPIAVEYRSRVPEPSTNGDEPDAQRRGARGRARGGAGG
jgi:transposase